MGRKSILAKFERLGFITFGNPNHYDGSGLLLRELRVRAREEKRAEYALEEIEAEFKEDYGIKLTEAEAVRKNMGDILGDRLSDLAPDGTVFEIRPDDRGNHNYGYFEQ